MYGMHNEQLGHDRGSKLLRSHHVQQLTKKPLGMLKGSASEYILVYLNPEQQNKE